MSPRRVIFLAATLSLLFAAAVMQVRSGDAGDKSWLLLAARMMLQGKKPYVDIFESNPPFVLWLYAIPEWLALHGLPLADFQILGLLGVLCCALSAWLCLRLIRLHPAFADKSAMQWDFGLLIAGIFIFFTTQVYFFDRDDIFFVLTFPYMMRFMPSCAKKPLSLMLRIAIGFCALIGFCIKPYTLIVFIILQGLYVLRERTLIILYSLENLLIYAGGISYLLCIWLFTPEYITVVAPMAAQTYSGFNRRINHYLFLAIAFLAGGFTFVDFRPRQQTPFRRDTYYFIGVCTAYLAYAFAGNGWGYTYNPLLCMLLFLSGWMLWEYGWLKQDARARGLPTRPFISGQCGCVANIALNTAYMLVCLFMFYTSHGCDKRAECSRDNPFIAYIKNNHIRSFGTLAVNLRQWTSVARLTNAAWDTRFNHLWMLPKLMQGGEEFQAQHQWIIDYVGKGLAEDLGNHKPDVVFVDANNAIFAYPHPVDILAFFGKAPAFREAWRHYRYSTTIDECEKTPANAPPPVQMDCRFDVYERMPTP